MIVFLGLGCQHSDNNGGASDDLKMGLDTGYIRSSEKSRVFVENPPEEIKNKAIEVLKEKDVSFNRCSIFVYHPLSIKESDNPEKVEERFVDTLSYVVEIQPIFDGDKNKGLRWIFKFNDDFEEEFHHKFNIYRE